MEENKENTGAGLGLGLFLFLAFAIAIGILVSSLIKQEKELAIEAEKIVQIMTDARHAVSCETIRKIDTGLPITTMNCFGTATCSAAKDDIGLRIFDNISGRQITKIGPTKSGKHRYYAFDASYEKFHDVCIAGVKS